VEQFLEQHVLQLAAHEVEVTPTKQLPHGLVRDSEPRRPVRLEKREPCDGVMDRLHLRQEAHTFGDVISRTEKVDHVAGVAQLVAPLDHDDFVACALQAQGECQARDSRSDDDYAHRDSRGTGGRGASQPVIEGIQTFAHWTSSGKIKTTGTGEEHPPRRRAQPWLQTWASKDSS
jgi:hypothetical protein